VGLRVGLDATVALKDGDLSASPVLFVMSGVLSTIRPGQGSPASRGGRRWWAHLEFTRTNTRRITLENQIEELIEIL
jgi:hypothetical protein